MQYQIRPFELNDAFTVSQWASTAEDTEALDTEIEFPLTPAQVAAWFYQTSDAFILTKGDVPVAYGEVLEDEVENDVEIQHLIVDPALRSTGVGQELVEKLCQFIAISRTYNEVWLRIRRGNIAAHKCAIRSSFTEIPEASGERFLWLKKSI